LSKEGRNRSFSQGSLEEFLEETEKRKKTGRQEDEKGEVFKESKKTARLPEVEKKTGTEMEKKVEKLEEMKVEIKDELKEMRKENQEVSREIEGIREEFKNKEKEREEEKNSLIGRVAQLERRRRKNNIVITGWKGEGKSKQQIKEDIENFIKENREEGNGRVEWERKW
jgi:septal ring factor EnvC (AmiA/AmiB activator)